MLEGKDLILATKPFAKENRALSWFHTVTTMFIIAAIILTIFYVPHWYFKLIASLLLGFVNVRMFVIYHDHQHHAILHKDPIGNFFFFFYGLYTLAPTSIWKRSHDYHHAHNSKLFSASIGSYPIMTKQKFESSTPSERRAYLFARHPLTILFGFFTMFLWGMCIESFRSSPRRHWDSLLAIVVHVGVAALIVIYSGWMIWFLAWFLPFFIQFCIGAYLFYAQHNFPGVKFKDNKGWTYEHAALESSSFMKLNAFFRWATANIGYHHIHHMNARIPFYRLPEAMKAISELQNPKLTSFKPKDVIACLKLKLWDPELQKMIPLPANY